LAAADRSRMAESAARRFKRLGFEQRVAAIGCLLLLVSTLGKFSFVEAAQILVALAVLALLRARAQGHRFHLPFGDGAVIAAAGAWAGVLILVRLFDRPAGQNLLALACAAILLFAGLREHVKRPPDDVARELLADAPDDLMRRPDEGEDFDRLSTQPLPPDEPGGAATEQMTLREPPDTARTEPLPPPEFEPGPASSAGRRRDPADEDDAPG
jgi:hypothetical protein